MKTLLTLLATATFIISSFSVFGFEIDSTEDSSIDFVAIEATLSSKVIHFQWDVNTEKSGDYFIIEKSTDKVNWRKVSRVESIENHKERHTYSVSEINLAEAGHEYFRITRIDAYGEEKILDVINVSQPILSNIYLIPVQGKVENQIRLSFDSLINAHGTIKVLNGNGENVFLTNNYINNGYNNYTLDIKSYPAGRYLIVIQDEFDNKITRSLNVFDESRKTRRSKF